MRDFKLLLSFMEERKHLSWGCYGQPCRLLSRRPADLCQRVRCIKAIPHILAHRISLYERVRLVLAWEITHNLLHSSINLTLGWQLMPSSWHQGPLKDSSGLWKQSAVQGVQRQLLNEGLQKPKSIPTFKNVWPDGPLINMRRRCSLWILVPIHDNSL